MIRYSSTATYSLGALYENIKQNISTLNDTIKMYKLIFFNLPTIQKLLCLFAYLVPFILKIYCFVLWIKAPNILIVTLSYYNVCNILGVKIFIGVTKFILVKPNTVLVLSVYCGDGADFSILSSLSPQDNNKKSIFLFCPVVNKLLHIW